MTTYKIVKYCRMCRKRFTVLSGRPAMYYCDECLKKLRKKDIEK